MYIIEDYATAVLFCLITMLCWGSWANTQKLAARNWRFELYYWDYVIGIVLTSLLFAFTLGSTGSGGRSFLPDLWQAAPAALWSAFLGGILFNAANILLVAAIAIAGMSVAFPVGIGLALTIGVIVNYVAAPVGDAATLFTGVGLVVVAILLNATAYRRLTAGRAGNLSVRGLVLAILAGSLMGLFYKYVAAAMFPDFQRPQPGLLSPYTAVVVFAAGILVSNFLFNSLVMWRPFQGEPVRYRDYFAGSRRSHLTGVLGGLIWCVGMSCSILAADQAGPAISYGLGQGATVVAALWGIFIWREFQGADSRTHALLYVMLAVYILGLGLIIYAR
jgi:glucose uptake protein